MLTLPLLFFFIIIIPSSILHEYAHGWMADQLGDPTARYAGRLSLDPRVHIDRWGTLLMPLLLFFKRRWSLIVLQCFSVVAALTWCYTLYWIIQERIYSGRSWFASAFILGLVALFALFSGWLLNTHQKKINSQISSIP